MIAPDRKQHPPEAKNWLEWVVFAVGSVLTAVTIGCLVYHAVTESDRRPPEIVVRLGMPEHHSGRYAVPVVVENRGDETAEGVHVEVTLAGDGGEERADFEIAYLPRHGTEKGVVTFDSDPRNGTLTARPLGYAWP